MTKSSTKVVNLVLQTSDVKNSVKSFQLSKKYVKRLMKISVLNILHHRIDIPDSEFEPKKYEKVSYVVFRRKSQNKFIRAYHSIATGILDAIEKDFLKEISVYILRKTTREPLETYNIKVKYNKEESKSDKKAAGVKEETREFLKALTDLPGKKLKEENVELFVQLSYNEDTPREYEPPNFEAAKESLTFGSTKFVILGKINTGFHKISAWGRGKNFSESRASTPAPVSLEEDLQEDGEEIVEKSKKRNKENDRNVPAKKRKVDLSNSVVNISDEMNLDNISIVSSVDYVSCLCLWELPEEYETVKCSKCFGTVHLACHGYMSPNAVDENQFTCYSCSDAKNIKGNLSLMMKLRIIVYGISVSKSIPDELRYATKDERNYILAQLEKFGVRSSSSTSVQDINLQGLNSAIQSLFQTENSQYFE